MGDGPIGGTGRRVAAVGVVAVLGVVGSACDAVSGSPDAEPVADRLARSLSSGTLDGVTTAGLSRVAAGDRLASITDGLGDVQPTVTLSRLADTEAGATATLQWHWQVEGHDWRYSTKALLRESDRADGGWAVRWTPALVQPQLEDGQVLDVTTVTAPRGDILGAGGVHLVTGRPVYRVGIDKTKLRESQLEGSASQLAALVGLDVEPYVRSVQAAGGEAFVQGIVLRRSTTSQSVLRDISRIPGATAISDELPLAPTKEFAAPLLGVVGDATAEVIKKSDGAVQAGDVVGLSGLQLRYDEQLRGTPGVTVTAVDEKTGVQAGKPLFTVAPRAGKPLRTTLDEKLQALADSLLLRVRPASGLVAIRPSTGAVLAAASGPGGDGYTTATYGQYAPGSTFKMVSSLALLRSGLTPSSPVPCTTSVTVDGKRFENYDDYPSSALGRIPLLQAVANSCNTAIIASRDRLDDSTLSQAAAALGIGIDHDLGFPAYFGQVPPAASETEAAADLIGQGKVLASPFAMATAIASVQQGSTVLPQLLPDYTPSEGEEGSSDGSDAEEPAAPLTRAEARGVRSMLRAVVTQGSGALLADLPGPPVIAKTGTAEYGTSSPPRTHAWMVAAQGDLAVCVFVADGSSGSGTAGPILESFLRGARR